MRRAAVPMLGLGCALGLLLFCYRAVLFRGEMFAFRDAGTFYDPLHRYVQQEWGAGRWPLWDPGQNGGMPLLGNPVAAVFYPGKVLFAALPYAWASRLYVVAHTVVAFAGMLALLRAWGTSWVGACLAAMSYAFGAPILFQYCNPIFLVGAAWVPWAFRALDRLLRCRRRSGLIELAAVLALQVLGGDPEAAYLTALCGAGYAWVLARLAAGPPRGPRAVLAAAMLAWVAAVLAAGAVAPRVAAPAWTPPRWAWQALLWGGIGAVVVGDWRRRPGVGGLAAPMAGLAGACALAMMLAAVQLLPAAELARFSFRAVDDAPMDAYRFSIDPWRVAEAAWPSCFGLGAPENRSWLQAFPPVGDHAAWVESLYLGGLTVALALGAAGLRGVGRPWQAWLTAVAAVGLAASFGRSAGPLWWARWLPAGPWAFGPHEPVDFFAPRGGPSLGDGWGSPYGILAAALPGFGMFRYPGKLLTFAAAATAALAGLGWDLLAAGRTSRPSRWCGWGLAATAAALAFLAAAGDDLAAILARRTAPFAGLFGPADLPAALGETRRGLVQGGIVLALGLGLAALAPRRPRPAGAAALAIMAIDLALANGRLVWTAPQAEFDATPRLARLIRDAERETPGSGPFRIHRMDYWEPAAFTGRRSPRRIVEWAAWSRDTLQDLGALPQGLDYTMVKGVLEPFDYRLFFEPQQVTVRGAMAEALRVADGRKVVFYPRRGLDLWNTRYFVVPADSGGWASPDRAFASLLPDTRPVARDPSGDWQLLRNEAAFPRAWLVHSARVVRPVGGRRRDAQDDDRLPVMRDLLYQADPFWNEPGRAVLDLRATAIVEADEPARLSGAFPGGPVGPSESVAITGYGPQRVELTATLDRPGLVVLADAFYPGWELTIDGVRAPIERTNRLMRGAAVAAGTHRLVYRYNPGSFRLGLGLSAAGLAVLALLAARASWGRGGAPAAARGGDGRRTREGDRDQ